MEMFNAEHLQEKWDPILNYDGAPIIKDSHRKMVTAVLLENQEKFLREQNNFLYEASPTNSGNAAGASGAFGSASTLLVHQRFGFGSCTYQSYSSFNAKLGRI